MYIQDFPRQGLSMEELDAAQLSARGSGEEFYREWERVLTSLSIPESHAIRHALQQYHFRRARAHLVASWPITSVARGWHDIEQAGLGRLGRVARTVCPNAPVPGMRIEAQGSSLASYDRRWLEHFYLVACGYSPSKVVPIASKRAEHASPEFTRVTGSSNWPAIQVLFPTQSYVEHVSVEGSMGGGCFFGKPEEFLKRGLRCLYAQPVSSRGHLLMHAKSLLVTNHDNSCGYVYLGSHNFTRAAWGTISGTQAQPTQSLSNWELGIVLPLTEYDAWDAIPYNRHIEPYGADDIPWDASNLLI